MGFLNSVGDFFKKGWSVADNFATAALDVVTAPFDQDAVVEAYHYALGPGSSSGKPEAQAGVFDKIGAGIAAPFLAPLRVAEQTRVNSDLSITSTNPETVFTDAEGKPVGDSVQRLNEIDRFTRNAFEYGVDRPLQIVPNIVSMQTEAGQTGLDAWLPDSVNDLRGAWNRGGDQSLGQAYAMLPYHGATGRFAAVIMGAWANPFLTANLVGATRNGGDDRGLTAEGRQAIRVTGGKNNTFDWASGTTDLLANIALDPTNLAGGMLGKAVKAQKGLITARNLVRMSREVETGTGKAGMVMGEHIQAQEALRNAALDAKSAELTKDHLEQVAKFDTKAASAGDTAVKRIARDRAKKGVKTARVSDEQIIANVRAKRVAKAQAKGFDPTLTEIKAAPQDLSLPELKPWVIQHLQKDMTADVANLTAAAMRISDDGLRFTAYRHITRVAMGDMTAVRDLEEMKSALTGVANERGNIGLDELQHIIEKRPIEQGELQNLAYAAENPGALDALKKYNESWAAKLQPSGTLDESIAFLDKAITQAHSYRYFSPGPALRAAKAFAGTEYAIKGTKAARQTAGNSMAILSGKYALDKIYRGTEILVGGNATKSTVRVITNPVDTANEVWRLLKTHTPSRIIPLGQVDQGTNALVDYMDTARVRPDVRNRVLSQFASVPDNIARGRVAEHAEAVAIASLMDHYGIRDADTVHNIIKKIGGSAGQHGRSERYAVNEYTDAAGKVRKADSFVDGEGNVTQPLLATQHKLTQPLLDIRRFDKEMLRAHKRINALGDFANHPGWRNGKMAQHLYDAGVKGIDITDAGLGFVFNKVWKFAAVFHGGYMFRNVIDGDLSVAAHLGGHASMSIIATRIMKFGLVGNLRAKQAIAGDLTKLHQLELLGKDTPEELAEIARLEEKTSNAANYKKFVGVEAGVRVGNNRLPGVYEGWEGGQVYNLSKGDIGAAYTTDLGRQALEQMRSGQWEKIKAGELDHPAAWAHVINRQMLQDQAVLQVLKNDLDHEGLAKWLTGTVPGRAYAKKLGKVGFDPDDWSRRTVGMVNHYLPPEVQDEFRRVGQEFTPERLKDLVPEIAHRPDVHGEEIASQFGLPSFQRMVDRTTAHLMRFIGDLPDNQFTRHPTVGALYQLRAKEILNAHVGEELTTEELSQIASASRKFALNEVKKVLYDLDHHSNMATKMRFISPFFNAFQEGVTRYGAAVKDNPNVLYNAYRAWNMPNRNGFIVDEYGHPVTGPDTLNTKNRLAIPIFTGHGAKDWKLGGNYKLSKSALNIALQGNPFWSPGAGPIVTIPLGKVVGNLNNEHLEKWWSEYVDPYGTANTGPGKGLVQAFYPAWLKRAQAIGSDPAENREAHAAFAHMMQDAWTEYELNGRQGPPPNEDKIAADAQTFMRMRLLFNSSLPFVPRNEGPFSFLRDRYRQLLNEQNTEHPDEIGWASDQFLTQYGDDFRFLITSGTKGGAGIGTSVSAERSFRAHRDLIAGLKNPFVAGAITNPESGGEFSPIVYNSQIGEKINPNGSDAPENLVRSYKDIRTMHDDAEISSGWSQYRALLHDLSAEAMDRGGQSYQDFDDLSQIRKNAIYGLSYNPDGSATPWGREFNAMRAPLAFDNTIDDFKSVVADPKLKDRQDVKILADYVQVHDWLRHQLLARPSQNIQNQQNTDLRQTYAQVVNNMAQANTVFDDVWFTRFISNDPYYDDTADPTQAGVTP